jgi:hypothetical protein
VDLCACGCSCELNKGPAIESGHGRVFSLS